MKKTAIAFFLLIFVSCTSNKYTAMNSNDAKIFLNKKQNKDWFAQNYTDYKPDENQVKRWAKHSDKKILIFAGTWCGDTRFLLPKFFKCLDMLTEKPVLEIIWVNQEKKSKTKLEQTYHLERVPTFIILKNGKEISRVVEEVKVSIEKDIADALEVAN